MIGLSLVDLEDLSSVSAIHFDIFNGISALGIPLVSTSILAGESSVKDGVRTLSRRARVLATTLHHLAWSGGWEKDKYSAELRTVLRDPVSKDWLHRQVESALGPGLADGLLDAASAGEMTPSPRRKRWVLSSAFKTRARAEFGRTVQSVLMYWIGHVFSIVRPAGWVGRSGDRVPGHPTVVHNLEIACGVSQHGYSATSMRCPVEDVRTLNGEPYLKGHQRRWRRAALFRWIAPSIFLWVEAKRARVVVLENLPLLIRVIRASPISPRWIAAPQPSDNWFSS